METSLQENLELEGYLSEDETKAISLTNCFDYLEEGELTSIILINASEKEILLIHEVYSESLTELILLTDKLVPLSDELLRLSCFSQSNDFNIISSQPKNIYIPNAIDFQNYLYSISPLSRVITYDQNIRDIDCLLLANVMNFVCILVTQNLMTSRNIMLFNECQQMLKYESTPFGLNNVVEKIIEIENKYNETADHEKEVEPSIKDLKRIRENIPIMLRKIYNNYKRDNLDIKEIIDEVHLHYLNNNKQAIIIRAILFIQAIIINCASAICIDAKNFKDIKRMVSILQTFVAVSLENIVLRIILKFEVSEIIIAMLYDMLQKGGGQFLEMMKNFINVKRIDATTNPKFFFFINNEYREHLACLLENPVIFQAFHDLDSYYVQANNAEQAKIKFHENIMAGSSSLQTSHSEYMISKNEVYQEYVFEPHRSATHDHIFQLIPQSIIVVPSLGQVDGLTKALNISFAGKTLIGGTIALKDYLINANQGQSKAKLIVVLTHELGHKKRLLHSSYDKFSSPTPEKFYEAGLYVDKSIYNAEISTPAVKLSLIKGDLAEKILRREALTNEEAKELFSGKEIKDSSDESDEGDFICDKLMWLYLEQKEAKKRLDKTK